MSSAWVTAFEKQHLWMLLRALGLEPGSTAIAGGKVLSCQHLGVNMFDKMNHDAFHIVSYFLFQTLDASLTKEIFKVCWPPLDQKSDTEFRKHCCEWLKKISAECGSSFPQVVGSLFLSPGGPKFIHLMYHFARYVAIKYIKTNSKKSSLHFADTFNVKPQDMHRCLARCHVARNRFLRVLQREYYVTQKYQENAQLLVKQVQNLRSECVGLQNQVKKMESCDDQSKIQEEIQKVRSLWTLVNETLMFLEKEREVVSSVLSLVNQYTLDGTDVVINIPRLLLDHVEKQMCQLQIGNVYEAGKLNLLTVIQLLNEVLKIMKYECCKADQARLAIDLHYLEKETSFQKERLSDLKHLRHKIKEDFTAIRHSVIEKQGAWHKKWKEFLGLSPFSLSKGCTPAVDLLPPMSPLSFDPVSEEVYAKSILAKYPASLSDIHKEHDQENGCRRDIDALGLCDPSSSPDSLLLPPASSSSDRNSVTLLEKDTNMKTPKEKTITTYKQMPAFEVNDAPLSPTTKNTQNSPFRSSLLAKKRDLFQKEQDHLVEEVARTVLSDSPQLSEGKEVKLEELIGSLASNPFLTRNQIPRTPENLITEIRSSWRKAIEAEDNRREEPIEMTAEPREVLPESSPVVHNPREFSMASFFLDFDQSLPEEKVVSDCFKQVPQKHLVTSHVGKLLAEDQSDLLNKKIICKQNSECTKFSETSHTELFSPMVGSRTDTLGRSGEDYVKMLDHSHTVDSEPSMYKTTLWNSFQILSDIESKSLKDVEFGILHETLPEEVGHLSLNSSRGSEASFKVEQNSSVHSGIFPDGDMGKKQTTPESDFNLQAIRNSYEALKKSLSKIREESYLSNPKALEKHEIELNPTPQNIKADDTLNFLDTHDLFIDCTKPSLHMSFGERKQSVTLIKFSLVDQKLRTIVPCSLGELPANLKEEVLKKSLDGKESLTSQDAASS
uniref:LOW QUALITY PROTEIN: HAUS augmin-like complex subunit 6 n=1 Tax=Jaculus jaculus TaxID=51337 RepID=UPI001E1B24F0|nr:LOW QUALITY PROTEIN: HAUS augmin-like complex subunit 6 [Jaculus jaculus]